MPIPIVENLRLDCIGILEGTDKTFLGNDYLRHYGRVLAPYRNAEINVVEIGVLKGSSLRTWKKYFTKANIVGVDIAPSCRQYADDRVIIEIGSQADPAFLQALGEKYAPTVVIDDGSHRSDDQICSLEGLFPFLAPGGVYVVEDLFFQLNPADDESFRGDGPVLATDYLLRLARETAGARLDPAETRSARAEISRQLDRIEFVGGTAMLFKKSRPRPAQEEIALAEQVLEGSTAELAWDRLYVRAMRPPVQLGAAERAAHRALAANGNRVWFHSRLSEIREQQGRLPEAIAEAGNALELRIGHSDQAALQARLDRLLAAAGSVRSEPVGITPPPP